MKYLLRIAVVLSALVLSLACTKDDVRDGQYLEVTPNNISGAWTLTVFCGEPLVDGIYNYLEIQRRDKKYVSYENITGTMNVAVKESGEYDIYGNNVINGIKDYNFKKYWDHAFTISELTEDRMVWTATDDSELVLVYVRCDGIPSDIASED